MLDFVLRSYLPVLPRLAIHEIFSLPGQRVVLQGDDHARQTGVEGQGHVADR